MSEKLVKAVSLQWEKSNSKFKLPVVIDKKSLVQRLTRLREQANSIALKKKTKKAVVSSFESKLDKLFDITLCQCSITLCCDTGPSVCRDGCVLEVHINCTCMRAQKVLLLELAWLKSQRDKIGSKSNLQMETVDKKDTKKQQRSDDRKKGRMNPVRSK